MTNPDLLLAMTEAEIGREIIRLVPHWYEAQYGPQQYTIPVGGHTVRFCNHCRLTPNLRTFLSKISARTQALPLELFANLPSLIDVLLESFAIEWLRMHSPTTDWVRFIKYLESLARRTYENQPVALNLIIRQGEGFGDITRPHIQKFFDRLASSAFSYLAVDSDLRLIDYGEVEWSQVKAATSYKFHPEFLHPIHSVMDETDLSAHLTTGGDLIIMSKAGLLATRRNRKWKIYDVRTFKNSLAYCLGSHYVGANLFEVVFDLSFRRQGSLLIYDPDYLVASHILNPESIVSSDYRRKAQGSRRPDGGLGRRHDGRPEDRPEIGGFPSGDGAIADRRFDRRHFRRPQGRFAAAEAAADRDVGRRRRRGVRRRPSAGRGGPDSFASQRRQPPRRPGHGRPLGVSLGRPADQSQFRRRRGDLLQEPQRGQRVRRGDEFSVTRYLAYCRAASYHRKGEFVQSPKGVDPYEPNADMPCTGPGGRGPWLQTSPQWRGGIHHPDQPSDASSGAARCAD